VDVDTVTQDGGSPILSYSIEIDDGLGYVSLIGDPIDSTALTTIATSLNSG
jgi:hypothetical protein